MKDMSEPVANREQEQRVYLTRLRALSESIVSAIAAIECNDIANFQNCVATQESICGDLSVINQSFAFQEGDNRELLEEIKKAQIALAHLNLVYSALITRSKRTTDMVAGLFRCYGLGYDKGRSSVAEPHAWSCEV